MAKVEAIMKWLILLSLIGFAVLSFARANGDQNERANPSKQENRQKKEEAKVTRIQKLEKLVESYKKEFAIRQNVMEEELAKLQANFNDVSVLCYKMCSPLTESIITDCPDGTDIAHDGMCYRAILNDTYLTFDEAAPLCDRIGWKLANIDNVILYSKIANFLRDNFPELEAHISDAWLGMTWDPVARALRYSSGDEIPNSTISGLPLFINKDPSYKQVGIHIEWTDSKDSVIHTFPRDSTRSGALCEYEPL